MITVTEDMRIQRIFERLFPTWNQKEGPRGGLHASSILNDDQFCYREHIFGTFYKREVSVNSAHLCAIFLDGWITHEKWQRLFSMQLDEAARDALALQFEQALLARGEDDQELLALIMPEIDEVKNQALRDKWQFLFGEISGIADEVEQAHYMEEWGLSFTPDALIRLPQMGTRELEQYVVEIKGYNAATYDDILSREDPMGNPEFKKAAVQANLYMHMLGIEKAIILIENKGNQRFRVWVRTYDPAMAEPYVLKLNNLKKLVHIYQKKQLVPQRLAECSSIESERAQKCPLRTVCFARVEERAQYVL